METKPVNVTKGIAPLADAKTSDVRNIDAAQQALNTNTGKSVAGKNGQVDWRLDLSDAAKQRAESIKKAVDIARSTPDVREDRVMELKKLIAEGKYQPQADKIADGMLREAILNHLAEEGNEI